jgi:hypothetical protein
MYLIQKVVQEYAAGRRDFSRLGLLGETIVPPLSDALFATDLDLSGINLQDAQVEGVRFTRVKFTSANLKYATFTRCIFSECDFSSADLTDAHFAGNEINGCIFEEAVTLRTYWQPAGPPNGYIGSGGQMQQTLAEHQAIHEAHQRLGWVRGTRPLSAEETAVVAAYQAAERAGRYGEARKLLAEQQA